MGYAAPIITPVQQGRLAYEPGGPATWNLCSSWTGVRVCLTRAVLCLSEGARRALQSAADGGNMHDKPSEIVRL